MPGLFLNEIGTVTEAPGFAVWLSTTICAALGSGACVIIGVTVAVGVGVFVGVTVGLTVIGTFVGVGVFVGFSVGVGVFVGTIVGLGGSSGRSTGPHLHYEIRYKGNPFNPSKFVKE